MFLPIRARAVIARALAAGAEQHGVTLEFIKPGKPMQNGFIEDSIAAIARRCSTWSCFRLCEMREQTDMRVKEYNDERPHDALEDMTPREFPVTRSTARSISEIS